MSSSVSIADYSGGSSTEVVLCDSPFCFGNEYLTVLESSMVGATSGARSAV